MELAVKWLSLLHEPDAIIEIRSIDPKPIVSGYFRADSPRIAAELAKYPNRTFYQSLNPVKSACYARAQHERLVERPKETTSDNDIVGFQWILIDADPVRPSGVSASAEEKEAAHAVAGKTMKRLMATGFSEPIVADSGNGYHLLLRCISARMTGKWLRIFSLCWTCGSAQTRQKLIRRCITHQELPSCMEQLQRKEPIRRNVRTDRAASSAIRSRFEKHPLRWSRILQRNCIKRRYRQKLGVPAKKALGTLSIFFPHMAWRWRKSSHQQRYKVPISTLSV